MNRVTLIGAAEAVPRNGIANGLEYSNFTVVTYESFFNRYGLPVERTLFHRVVAFGRLAKAASQHVQEGSSIQVSGRINYRTYVGSDNVQRTLAEIVADDIQPQDFHTRQQVHQEQTQFSSNP
jgi:single-strand DNA-binding protein